MALGPESSWNSVPVNDVERAFLASQQQQDTLGSSSSPVVASPFVRGRLSLGQSVLVLPNANANANAHIHAHSNGPGPESKFDMLSRVAMEVNGTENEYEMLHGHPHADRKAMLRERTLLPRGHTAQPASARLPEKRAVTAPADAHQGVGDEEARQQSLGPWARNSEYVYHGPLNSPSMASK